jgi:SAM-dependent methyltransferase
MRYASPWRPSRRATDRAVTDPLAAQRWDDEYRAGRYVDEPPLAFVDTILEELGRRPATRRGAGLYVGCGNGRNYLALADAGLSVWGLDVSAEALRQLTARRPDHATRLRHGDFLGFRPDGALAYLIAIQVFQHGRQADAEAYFARTHALLDVGGLFFLRVNSATTEVHHDHEVVERNAHGGFTVEYRAGPKRGLPIHFYGRAELAALTDHRFRRVAEPREDVIRRAPPKQGSWAQWEAVYEKR